MFSQNLEIVFFDINSFEIKREENKQEEEIEEKKEENNVDTKKENSFPFKVIKHFLDNHILIDNEIEEFDDYDEYSFIGEIQKDVAKQCKFYLFSKATQESFMIDFNGLFIFCDLQNEKTKELLDKMKDNIKRICPPDIIIYIIGIIKSHNECFLNKESISKLFNEEEIYIKYDEININDNNIIFDDKNIGNDNNFLIKNNNDINNNKIDKNNIDNENKIIINNNDIINDDKNNIIKKKNIDNDNNIIINNNDINNDDKNNIINESNFNNGNNIIKENNINNDKNLNNILLENHNNNHENYTNNKKIDNQNKNEELNNKEDLFIKIDKLIENAMIDIYKYEQLKKQKIKYKKKKLEFAKEMDKSISCLIY